MLDSTSLPSDSQLTLLNPEPPLELVLEHSGNNWLNTRLLVQGIPWFKLSTVDAERNVTEIIDLRTNEVVATIRRPALWGSEKVKFARRFGGKSVKRSDWIQEIKLPNGHPAWIVNSESGKFQWRWDVALRMVLTPLNAPEKKLAFVKDEPPIFALTVQRAAEGSLDEILTGFAILEHRLRMERKVAGRGLADAIGGV